ncbi:MAG: hypothetical protein ABFS19_04520 [Thermodesulfobacteriota bacterium]
MSMAINELTIAFIVLYMMLTVVALVPPAITKTRYWVSWWDFVYPLIGMPLWLFLWWLGVGEGVSTTNFAFEVFCILILSVAMPWMRYYLAYAKSKTAAAISFSITFVPILVTAFFRFFMPELPS